MWSKFDQRRTYLKEWRKFRHLTQAQTISRIMELAGDMVEDDPALRVPKTEASLSRIENGKQPYTQAVLEVLAEVYQTQPDYLIARNPTKEGKVLSILDKLSPEQYRQAEAVLEALARSGTEG